MKRIKICLCLSALMLAGCASFERVEHIERHHYHGGTTTQPAPESVRIDRTITIEVRR